MKTICIFIIFVICYGSATAQVNYVLNPSFEDYSQCPTGLDQIKRADHWSCVDTNGPAPFAAGEFLHACAGNSLVGVPSNGGYFHHYARTGDGMMMAIVFYDESQPSLLLRDNNQGRLTAALTPGVSYCVTFYVCLAPFAYAINNIGAYLDDGTIDTLTQGYGLVLSQYSPQVHATSIISDSINWTKVEGSFIANGTEKFITIANFFDKANTNYLLVMDPQDTVGMAQAGTGYSNYLIDDVSVIESDLPAYAGNDTTINEGDSVFIGRDEIIPGIKWSTGNIVIDTVHAGLWVKPPQTTTYMMEQTLCGQVKYDTVTIVVLQDTTIDTIPETVVTYLSYDKGFSIYPNPTDGNITIYSSILADKEVGMRITDLSGRLIKNENITFSKNNVNIQLNIVSGVYIVELKNSSGEKYLQRLIIK